MRRAGFEDARRVRGIRFELETNRSPFSGLLQPLDPSEGLSQDFASGVRLTLPTDSLPEDGIRVGTVFRSEDGRRFRVESLAPSETAGVLCFNCDVFQGERPEL